MQESGRSAANGDATLGSIAAVANGGTASSDLTGLSIMESIVSAMGMQQGQGAGPLLANGAGGESATADATAHAELEPEASVMPEGGAFLDAGDLEAPFEVQRGRRGRAAAKSSSCSPAKGSSYSPDAYEVTSEAKDGGASRWAEHV